MKPERSEDAVVDLLDVILEEGVVVEADVIVSVADVPLVGVSLRAAVAGMATMTEYGVFDDRPDRAADARDRDEARPRHGISGRPRSGDGDPAAPGSGRSEPGAGAGSGQRSSQ